MARAFILVCLLACVACAPSEVPARGAPAPTAAPTVPADTPTPLPETMEIALAGDVNLGGRVGDLIARHGPQYPWTHVAPILRDADVTAVNLECAVSSRGEPVTGKQYTFRGDPGALRAMADAGVDIVSVANNHTLDYGRDALVDTIDHVRDAGMHAVGGGLVDEAYTPVVVEAKGRKVAFVAVTRVLPLGFGATDRVPGVASAYDERRLLAAVREARAGAEVVVVLVHWGVELHDAAEDYQVRLGRALVDAGASVVAGHHPHVLQPVERYNGAVIAYSLGNFVFSSSGSAATTRSMILRVRVSPGGTITIAETPVRIVSAQPRIV